MKRQFLSWLDRWVERHDNIRPIGGVGTSCGWGWPATGGVSRAHGWHRGPPGDLVGELHLDNQRAALHAVSNAGFRFRRELFRLLPALSPRSPTSRVPRDQRHLWHEPVMA